MKKIVVAFALFITTMLAAQAQDTTPTEVADEAAATEIVQGAGGKTPEERAANQTKKLTEKLALSTDQATQVQAALLERINAVQNIRSNVEKGGGRRKGAAKEVMQTFDVKIKGILTPDQYTKFQDLREDLKGKMKHRHKKNK